MINLIAGAMLFSAVISLGAAAVPDYFNWFDRLKGGLLALLVVWLFYAALVGFYLVGTGLAELEDTRHEAELEERLQR